MPTLIDLKETRAAKVAEMSALAKPDLNDEARARFDAIDCEIRALDGDILRLEKIAEYERRADATPVSGDPMRRELRNYSVARALQGSLAGTLTGLEAECHQELSKGRETRGIMIPVEVLLGERRAMTTAGNAGALKGTDLMEQAFIDRLRPALKTELLGATVLGGLVGNVDIPRMTGSSTAYWIGEDSATTRSDPSFDKVSLSAKTVSAETQFSRRLLIQSTPAIEGIVRNDLSWALSAGIDYAAIKGGQANAPSGILNLGGLQTVSLGANGAAPTPDHMADLIALPNIANVTGSTAFLTNFAVKKVAQKMKDGQGVYIGIEQFFQKERFEFTNQVPGNLTKGTGTNLSAVIYGAWADLIIAYWSGVDILVNPYHQDVASKGGVLVHAFLDCDVNVRHPESFAAIVDAVTQ